VENLDLGELIRTRNKFIASFTGLSAVWYVSFEVFVQEWQSVVWSNYTLLKLTKEIILDLGVVGHVLFSRDLVDLDVYFAVVVRPSRFIPVK
jgi:hypothetical protein